MGEARLKEKRKCSRLGERNGEWGRDEMDDNNLVTVSKSEGKRRKGCMSAESRLFVAFYLLPLPYPSFFPLPSSLSPPSSPLKANGLPTDQWQRRRRTNL